MQAEPTSPQKELANPPTFVINSAATTPISGKGNIASILPVPFCN